LSLARLVAAWRPRAEAAAAGALHGGYRAWRGGWGLPAAQPADRRRD
jgi:hypothetical protein